MVTLGAHQLSTNLHVHNTSPDTSLEFQALLHTYFAVPASEVSITPLQGLSYYDKTEKTEEARATAKIETREAVDVRKVTDSVYENASGRYHITWVGGDIHVRSNLKDVVVWNPQQDGAKIGDMEDGGW